VCRADNLTTFMCRLSRNLEASTSWNPVGLSRPVMGLLYLFLLYTLTIIIVHELVHGMENNFYSIYSVGSSMFMTDALSQDSTYSTLTCLVHV
jgi:hypothetical protein